MKWNEIHFVSFCFFRIFSFYIFGFWPPSPSVPFCIGNLVQVFHHFKFYSFIVLCFICVDALNVCIKLRLHSIFELVLFRLFGVCFQSFVFCIFCCCWCCIRIKRNKTFPIFVTQRSQHHRQKKWSRHNRKTENNATIKMNREEKTKTVKITFHRNEWNVSPLCRFFAMMNCENVLNSLKWEFICFRKSDFVCC